MSSRNASVVIAGAGLAGCILAHLLSRGGMQCTVVGQVPAARPEPRWTYDPRAISITPASVKILTAINIWQHLPAEKVGRIERIHVWDENSPGEVNFDSADACEAALAYIIEQSLLQDRLYQALSHNSRIRLLADRRVSVVSDMDRQIFVELDDGNIIKADLLVAADGLHSSVRRLAGLKFSRHDYQQTAVACIVKTSLMHENVARQRFLGSGPLAFLPMAEPDASGIVWSTSPAHAHSLMELGDQAFSVQLQAAFENRLGDIIDCQPRVSFQLFRANADNYIKGRCVLVGDAAHNVHPLAGQGANLGIQDVAVLAELMLTAAKNNRDIASRTVLRRYERWRRSENSQMIMAMEAIKFMFEQDNDVMNKLRGFGLDLINATPLIKNRIMRYAMGLAGDLPSLVRQSMVQGEL